jgi:large subunit ribosomal protein L18
LIAKEISRDRRHNRIRKKVSGTGERPRLSVYRSLNNIYAQIIDDTTGMTIVSASTLCEELKGEAGHKGNKGAAKKVGKLVADRALKVGVTKIVFDRSGYKYHGAISALAEGAREGNLEF